MDERFHGLIRGSIRLFVGGLCGVFRGGAGSVARDDLEAVFCLMARQKRAQLFGVSFCGVHCDIGAERFFDGSRQRGGIGGAHIKPHLNILRERTEILLAVRFLHALRHSIVEIRHALAAVHLVLVCLNGDARERGVAADVVRLSQIAVACGKSVLKQL